MADSKNRWASLYHASQDIGASHDLEELYRAVHNAAKRVMPCDDFILDGYDEMTNEVVPLYIIEPPLKRAYPPRYVADHGLAGGIIHSGIPIILNTPEEIHNSGIRFEMYGSEIETSSIVAVPMRLHGKVIGMLSSQSYQPNAYTIEDQELLEMLASHAAVAIENTRLFQQLKTLADTDPLTGILNRRRFFELADMEFMRSRQYENPLSIIMIDIDHFKRFNTKNGHKAGDQCLRTVVNICKEHIRNMDIFGRYGGEEFILLLPETTLDGARHIAEHLRLKVEQTGRKRIGQKVTISLGMAGLLPSIEKIDLLIEYADQALYQAKHHGRNRVEIWENQTRRDV